MVGRMEKAEREIIMKRKLSEIKISNSFVNTIPKEEKMNECRENWKNWHRQDRYIVVNTDGFLIDGYIQYLVLKENDVEDAQIKISNKRKKCWYRKNTYNWGFLYYRKEFTTYVYGVHLNSFDNKEYVWRVPKSWTWFAENVQVFDKILCNTKYGVAPVVVTKVQITDQCPVDFKVKKVASKEIRRNGCVVEGE